MWTFHQDKSTVSEKECAAINGFYVCFFSRHHNKIRSIDGRLTRELVSVETLDLSNNDITELRGHCFTAGLKIRDL